MKNENQSTNPAVPASSTLLPQSIEDRIKRLEMLERNFEPNTLVVAAILRLYESRLKNQAEKQHE